MARELVVCILNEPSRLHDVLGAFLEAGVKAATVVESQGMGHILSHDVPLFASFRDLFQGARPYNHTILAVVDDPPVVDAAVALVRDVLGDLNDAHKGVLFTLPVSRFVNLSDPA